MSEARGRRLERGARRWDLITEWDLLVSEVREIDGFRGFLRDDDTEVAYEPTEAGHVIVVNTHQSRCDAIIVGADGIRPLRLPRLTQEDIAQQTSDYIVALGRYEGAVNAISQGLPTANENSSRQHILRLQQEAYGLIAEVNELISGILKWLWESVAEPVLTTLNIDRHESPDEPWERIWWCSTGALGLFPLHAAGYHESTGDNALDRVVSSYIPSLRALHRARQRPIGQGAADERLLVVDCSQPPGYAPLLAAQQEVDLLERLIPIGGCDVLRSEAADRQTVLRKLGEHRYAHVIAHANQRWWDPSASVVALHDGELTILDLAAADFAGEFVCLAGCKTAFGGVALQDEALSLASALHHAGFRHVIGSLWNVEDNLSVTMTETLYDHLVVDNAIEPGRSAWAMHNANRMLREKRRSTPLAWTPFIHIGP